MYQMYMIRTRVFCVFDTFLGIYQPYLQKLTKERFIELCYQVRGIQINKINSVNSLDKGISDDDDDVELIQNTWSPQDGVSPKMLIDICEILDISHYSFDITNRCFLKYVSPNQNYPALVYYCLNNQYVSYSK